MDAKNYLAIFETLMKSYYYTENSLIIKIAMQNGKIRR